jgi:ParB family chromosome partitioning protein
MAHPRNALGRGLGALIPGAPSGSVPDAGSRPVEAPASELSLDAIDPNPEQPRRHFEEEQLRSLAASIQRHGVLQPVVVRRVGDRYELIVGERRWRAARAAGLTAIPAVVADVDPRERLDLALVENVQRHDLNPIELGHAFRALAEGGATQEEIGARVGLDRSTVANHLRLLELPRELQEDVELGRIGTGHAKVLLQVANPLRRRQLRDRIVNDGLSVRAAEQLGRPAGALSTTRPRRERTPRDPNLQRVIDALRQRLQTRVKIQGDGSRGRFEIEYYGADDLGRIAGILLGDG